MCVQLEFCSGQATKMLEIHQIRDRLNKNKRMTGGLFDALKKIEKDNEFLSEQLEQIEHEAIYGHSEET